jgi:DNA replication protein DnaC
MPRERQWTCLIDNPACDAGHVYDEDARVARRCGCYELRARQAQARRLLASIAPGYVHVAFDEPPIATLDPPIRQRLQTYCDSLADHVHGSPLDASSGRGTGLWMHGSIGTGKTSAAMVIAKTALEQGYTVAGANVSVAQLVHQLRAGNAPTAATSHDELLQRLIDAHLLVLDDAGTALPNDYALQELFVIVDARTRNLRPIIVTADLGPRDLAKRLGERIVSRLWESCGQLAFEGPDHRVQEVAHG